MILSRLDLMACVKELGGFESTPQTNFVEKAGGGVEKSWEGSTPRQLNHWFWNAVASAGPLSKQSAPRSRQITVPTPHQSILQTGCSRWRPTNSIKALNKLNIMTSLRSASAITMYTDDRHRTPDCCCCCNRSISPAPANLPQRVYCYGPTLGRVDWNCRTGQWRTGHWRMDMGNWL